MACFLLPASVPASVPHFLDIRGVQPRRGSTPVAGGLPASCRARNHTGRRVYRCAANAVRLKKIPSALPFLLRLQEYVELVKRGDAQAALAYARIHLAPLATEHLAEFKSAIALLVFGAGTRVPRYRALLAEERWTAVADVFLADLLRTQNLSPVPMLEVLLRVRPVRAQEWQGPLLLRNFVQIPSL